MDLKELVDEKGPTWDRVAQFVKPIIAAVAGYALAGCEIALQSDLIIGADSAKFGRPEITVGVIPGCGGTQRLTHAIGKAKAMDMLLIGRVMDAKDAEFLGLVLRVVSSMKLMDEAIELAHLIAAMSLPAAIVTKKAFNAAFYHWAKWSVTRVTFAAPFSH